MRIAQVSPLIESVPPKLYGGTERLVSFLTEELVREGHEVTLFATGDSVTRARLVAPAPRGLRLDPGATHPLAYTVLLIEQVMSRAAEFDVIHCHLDLQHFPMARRCSTPVVTTLHGRLDPPELAPLYAEFNELPLVSISNSQRKPLPEQNWAATVYHGLPSDLFRPRDGPGEYVAFLGRISPEKGADAAIRIAREAGVPLRIAAKIDRADTHYFERDIRPLLDGGGVEFIGEIGEDQKGEFLGRASALLFPIDWPEPFGLVMIEAMACGTPVVAFRRGSVPEIVDEGQSGFIVSSIREAVDATRRVGGLSRRAVRAVFDRRFTAGRMAADYLAVYRSLSRAERTTGG